MKANTIKRIQIVTVADDGTVTKSSKRSDHPAALLMELCIAVHAQHADMDFAKLVDLVTREASEFGGQMAFVDESATFVATRIRP